MNSQISNQISIPTQSQTKPSVINKAYFSSKNELLTWASKLLDLELTSFEEMSTGAVFCQLLDACHPGSVRLNKVNWKANCETDYISNFKIFQQGLETNNIYKPFDVNRLTKGKQYDLNELLQWIYGYYLSIKDSITEVYNAKKKRGGKDFVFNDKKNEIKRKYRNKINRNNTKERDNLSSISCNKSSNYSINSGNDNRKYFLNVSNLRQNLRNNNYNCENNEDMRHRNKSKQETRNNKYYDLKEKLLNNNDNNIAYTQNKMNNNNINTINNNNNIYQTINRRYPSNPINDSEQNSINNNFNTQSRRNFKNIFEKTPSDFQLNYNEQLNETENINCDLDELENQNELDITDFFGLNPEEIKKIIKEEKNDGNRIQDLKNVIRKLRINILSMEKELTNIKKTINSQYQLKNFYLNKLKDIEYLYFNPVIKNSNENKNTILRQILSSNQDNTIYLDENNYAYLRNLNLNIKENKNKSTILPIKIKDEDIVMADKTNMDNSINVNNNEKYNNDKKMKLNYSSKKNFNANYMDNLFDSFNDISKIENTNLPKNNYQDSSQFSNTFYTNNINIKTNYDNPNINYKKENGKTEVMHDEKKFMAYSEKKKENINNEEKNILINNKTAFKGNNLYNEISSLLLNDSLHIPNI